MTAIKSGFSPPGRPFLGQQRRRETDVMLDMDILRQVDEYATARGISRSEAINRLLAAALNIAARTRR